MRTLGFLLEKEFKQFFRNSFLPRMVLFFPLMTMLVMPWVTTMDVRHVQVVVVDNDRSESSRRFIDRIGASEYFTLQEIPSDFWAALERVEQGRADVILEIPDRFERELTEGTPQAMSITANGVNALKANIGGHYLSRMAMENVAQMRSELGQEGPVEQITVQNRYNPTLDYRCFMIPALMTMLLVMLCGFMPALNLVSEKEMGTIEQINVTPVSRFTFTLAKLIPYWLVGLLVLTIAMGVALAVYGLAPIGSLSSIYLAAILLILTMSGIGVIVANYSSTMQQTTFVMFFVMMIFVLMSGLLTPIESMPRWAQQMARMIPPSYFIDVMRSVYLKGTSFLELWHEYAALSLFASGLSLWAALSYRKQA